MGKSILSFFFALCFMGSFCNISLAQTCKDEITITQKGAARYDGKRYIRDIRVVEISKKYIHYKRCDSGNKEYVARKEDVLAIEYANGKYDKFDFDGKNRKKNMDLIRKPSYYE